jgi:hypothetical protein
MPDVGDVVDTSPLRLVPAYAVLTCEDVGPTRPVAPQLVKVYDVCAASSEDSSAIESDKMLLWSGALIFSNSRGKTYKHFIHKSPHFIGLLINDKKISQPFYYFENLFYP